MSSMVTKVDNTVLYNRNSLKEQTLNILTKKGKYVSLQSDGCAIARWGSPFTMYVCVCIYISNHYHIYFNYLMISLVNPSTKLKLKIKQNIKNGAMD